ncbi:hypothetical protein B0T17DRAFT_184209 [Bombardia bombarda]|uniref:Modin n=1 Tax=Bombardia bombarda TaxID=252184 RepID=A0AA39X8R7_9PEZI|nr:hypothetical protein B0T17DRAFT_184209 [Bombardia bombarda]
MDNSTASSSNGGGDGNGNDAVNWVALVVSLVALLGTIAQVLQQYYASAAGYVNCGESVMGEWHNSKRRKFRPYELRFEVQFEAPVIFVSFPANQKGPVKNQPINYVNGTPESLKATRSLLPQDEEKHRQALRESNVHTADNERATWVTLLSQLQSMERESAQWQLQQQKIGPPQPLLADFSKHTLAIAVQAKKRSWDTMPSDVRKPYATSAMCHVLEIAAMMGIYWKEFDRSKDKYRGEGNGFILTGSHVADLGLMFTFRIYGKSRFEENRVIPVDEVKELCCGFVSTIFQETKDRRRLEFPNEESRDLGFLQLGSQDEVAETMVQIECNTNTADYFRKDDKKHDHLFPVAFELLGMLGRTLHIRNSCFRMLPNPTPYHWDKNFFNLRRLIKEYSIRIGDTDILPGVPQVQALEELSKSVISALAADKGKAPEGSVYSMDVLNTLHDALDQCDKYLRTRQRDLLRMVLREHFQEVMKMINNPGLGEDEAAEEGDLERDDDSSTGKPKARRFDELSAASPEERQEKFMDIYFYVVLNQVRERAVQSFERRRSTHYAPSMRGRSPSLESNNSVNRPFSTPPTPPTIVASSEPSSPRPRELAHQRGISMPLLEVPRIAGHLPRGYMDTESLDTEAATIWCTLVFRMLCWLLLHDFHKKDVQIPKSELLGSRLPVYIA